MTDQTETARHLLDRHGLPEDVIDGALCLHAQELAAVQREAISKTDDPVFYEGEAGWLINLIEPGDDEPAAGVAHAADQTPECARCVHDKRTRGVLQPSTSELYPPDHDPGCPVSRRARYAKALAEITVGHRAFVKVDVEAEHSRADAVMAVADAEQAELRRDLALAIAHDRQPYPTAWAYEQACKALRRKTETIERIVALAERWENALTPDLAYARSLRAALDGAAPSAAPAVVPGPASTWAETLRDAADEQPETPLEKRLRYSERRNDELRTECKRRGKTVLEQSEKILALEKQLDEVRAQLGTEILRSGHAEGELRRLADEAQPETDDYEATTGHAITCGVGFGAGCQCDGEQPPAQPQSGAAPAKEA